MNVGDRVRLLHGKEEGVIVRVLNSGLIEVEIEEGFIIPVMKKEAVVVAKEEASSFVRREDRSTGAEPTKERINEKGLYFAFTEENEREMMLHIVNNTDLAALFTFSEIARDKAYGIANGLINPRSAVRVKNYIYSQLEQWPHLYIQVLLYKNGYYFIKPPLEKTVKVKASSFIKRKGKAPVLDQPAYLYQLDDAGERVNIDPEKLKETMLKGPSQFVEADSSLPPKVVDLHIDRLVGNSESIPRNEILNVQLAAFEKALDKAVEKGMDEIMFIHGVGNGVLRQAIHKLLSGRDNIVFYKDAMKEKFGYGATLVRIK